MKFASGQAGFFPSIKSYLWPNPSNATGHSDWTRLRRRRIYSVAGIVALVFALLYFAAAPTRDAVKGWQSRRHAQKAFGFIAQENWVGARDEATAAYQLRSSEPQALRAIARLLSRTRQQQALDFWTEVRNRVPLSEEDLRDEASVALLAGDRPRAERGIRELTSTSDVPPASWLLAAQLALQTNATPDALIAIEKVQGDPRTTERERLQATLLQLAAASSSTPADETQQERIADAWRKLEETAHGNTAPALDAL